MNKVSGKSYTEKRAKGLCVVKFCSNKARKDKGTKTPREYCNKHLRLSFAESKPYAYNYSIHKHHCAERNIPCEWTLEEFTKWCIQTNYLELKGVGAGRAVIDRIKTKDDHGNVLGYKIGNVQILEFASNSRKVHVDKKLREKYGQGYEEREPTKEELEEFRRESEEFSKTLNGFGSKVHLWEQTSGTDIEF